MLSRKTHLLILAALAILLVAAIAVVAVWNGSGDDAGSLAVDTIWTCSMHP